MHPVVLTPCLSAKFRHLSLLATAAVVVLHSRTFRWSGVADWTDAMRRFTPRIYAVLAGGR